MTKSNFTEYWNSIADDDSGIGLDYGSSSDINSSRSTLTEPMFSTRSTFPLTSPPISTIKPTNSNLSTMKITSDNLIERIRPATMKNSENGDFIICRTARGSYIARRTPIVPQWITDLVREIESQQR